MGFWGEGNCQVWGECLGCGRLWLEPGKEQVLGCLHACSGGHFSDWTPLPSRLGSIAEIDLGVPPPIMKSFKEFLLSLDDSVDETEAVKRYNDYKLDFRRQQMQDFFLAHKDEEW